jgi:hypothetical protein
MRRILGLAGPYERAKQNKVGDRRQNVISGRHCRRKMKDFIYFRNKFATCNLFVYVTFNLRYGGPFAVCFGGFGGVCLH